MDLEQPRGVGRLIALGYHLADFNLLLRRHHRTASADASLFAGGVQSGPWPADSVGLYIGNISLTSQEGNWLTREQASRLLALPDPATLKGKRDRPMLALLLGCGLRRDELVRLTFEDIQQRESRWVILDILGKGRRRRTIPVPSWVKVWVGEWTAAAGVTQGCVFRAINKGGRVYGAGLTANIVWSIVRGYAAEIGVPNLAPHDLRRTCAKLCRAAGEDLEQIQLLLGHASIATTERYLGSRLDLTNAVNDELGLNVPR
jgi:integrase